jgi:hypothetical protein
MTPQPPRSFQFSLRAVFALMVVVGVAPLSFHWCMLVTRPSSGNLSHVQHWKTPFT